MARLISIVLLALGIGGGTYAAKNYHFAVDRDSKGLLNQVTIVPIEKMSGDVAEQAMADVGGLPPRTSSDVIRIATFNLGGLDGQKLANRRVHDILLDVLPRFDIVALQNVRTRNEEIWRYLVEQINATGRHYEFATPNTGVFLPVETANGQLSVTRPSGAFLFDKTSIEVDRATVQTVDDPADMFSHDPLMALFRARGAEPNEAFTFKLVSIHTDPARAKAETELLDDLYRVIRDSGDNEDDIILAGTFATFDGNVTPLTELLDMVQAVVNTPTTIGKRPPQDNLVFNRQTTSEFNGVVEVTNLMAEFQLTLQAAIEVSEHFPVWAEFHCREGASPARMATAPPHASR